MNGLHGRLRNLFSFQGLLRIVVLICSLVLIGCISYDTFMYNNPFYQTQESQRIQFWVCVFFLVDLVIEFVVSPHKLRYLFLYFILFLACVPWFAVVPLLGLTLPRDLEYVLRFVPLIRSFFALAIVIGWFTYNRSSKVFLTYLCIVFVGVYFGSLAFYVCEVNVNPLVHTYWDALWWASMEAITVGSNIVAVTPIGKVLSIVVALLGLLVIPMFTVYVTNIVGVFKSFTTDVVTHGHDEGFSEKREGGIGKKAAGEAADKKEESKGPPSS